VSGMLTVPVTSLDVTGSGVGQLTISCSGGECPWHLVVGGALSADVRQGVLSDGGSTTVTVTVDAAALAQGGSQVIKVWPGDVSVMVSWSAPPPPSAPTDSPADVPADTPSAIPTS